MTGKRAGAPAVLLFLARHIPAAGRVVPRFVAFGPRPEHAPAFARRTRSPARGRPPLTPVDCSTGAL